MEASSSQLMKPVGQTLISCLLALVFMYAGFTKAMDTLSFYRDIRDYHLLADQVAWWWAHFLPWLEMVGGAALLVKATRFAASAIISLLLLIFMAAIISAWARGLNIDCGCFGEGAGPSNYSWMLFRDATMLLAATFSLATGWEYPSQEIRTSS